MITSNSSIDFIAVNNMNKENDNMEYLASPDFKEWLLDILKDKNPLTVTFMKKDSSLRTMKCTRNLNNIPSDKHPQSSTSDSSEAIRAFDLEKMEWRSFIPSSITRIEYSFGE